MGKIEAQTCGVCHKNPSKYRCPGCALPYCSLACNKVHKASGGTDGKLPCSGKRRNAEQNATQQKRQELQFAGESTVSTSNPLLSAKRQWVEGNDEGGKMSGAPAPKIIRKGRDQWRGGKLEENEEEEWAMSADQRARMLQCDWLKSALRDTKLQGLLVSKLLLDAKTTTIPMYDALLRSFLFPAVSFVCWQRRVWGIYRDMPYFTAHEFPKATPVICCAYPHASTSLTATQLSSCGGCGIFSVRVLVYLFSITECVGMHEVKYWSVARC